MDTSTAVYEAEVFARVDKLFDANEDDTALKALEKASDDRPTAAICQMLGDVYLLGCVDGQPKAKVAYEKALELCHKCEDLRDVEIQLAAKGGLVPIETALGNTDKANQLLQEAQHLSQSLEQTLESTASEELKLRIRSLAARGCGECTTSAGNTGRWVRGRCKTCNC